MESKTPIIKYIFIVFLVTIIFATLYFLNQQASKDHEAVYTILTYTAAAVFLIFFVVYIIKAGILGLIRHASARKIVGFIFLGLIIISLGIIIFVSTDKRDIPKIDGDPTDVQPIADKDLTLDSFSLADQDNMYSEATNMTTNLKTDLDSLDASNTEWDTNRSLQLDAINNILQDNSVVMDNFENALNKKGYEVPADQSLNNHKPLNYVYLYYNDPNIKTLYIVAKIQQLKAAAILHKSFKPKEVDYNSAFNEAIKIVRLGDILTKSPVSPSDFKIALKIKALGLETIRNIFTVSYTEEIKTDGSHVFTNYAGWSKEDYIKKARILQGYKDSSLGESLAIKKTYTDSKAMYQKGWYEFFIWETQNYTSNMSFSDPVTGRSQSRDDRASYLGRGTNYYFKPNETIALQADITREYLKAPSEICTASMPEDEYFPAFTKLRSQDLYHLKSLSVENLKGKWAVDSTSGAFLELNYRRCESEQAFDSIIIEMSDYGVKK